MFSSSLIMGYMAPCLKELLPFVNDNPLYIRIWKLRGHPCPMDTFLVFLIILAQSNFDHYARECEFRILKGKQNKTKKKQENLSAVFLTK